MRLNPLAGHPKQQGPRRPRRAGPGMLRGGARRGAADRTPRSTNPLSSRPGAVPGGAGGPGGAEAGLWLRVTTVHNEGGFVAAAGRAAPGEGGAGAAPVGARAGAAGRWGRGAGSESGGDGHGGSCHERNFGPEGFPGSPFPLLRLHLPPRGHRVAGDGGGMWRWVRQQLVGASRALSLSLSPFRPRDAFAQSGSLLPIRRPGAARSGRGCAGLGRGGGGRGARSPETTGAASPRLASKPKARSRSPQVERATPVPRRGWKEARGCPPPGAVVGKRMSRPLVAGIGCGDGAPSPGPGEIWGLQER